MTTLYQDQYLEIFDSYLLLKGYYFLGLGQKKIQFDEVEEFQEKRLTYFNGLTRHEQVWLKPRYPFDWKIKDRKEVLYIKKKGALLGIGFSAENPHEVALILHKKIKIQ